MPSNLFCNSLPQAQLPLVSVIMPIRNEEKAIRQSIGSVLQQDYPAEAMEIIVVDGLSDDNTRQILKELESLDPRIRVLDNPGRIMAKGFNIGVRQSRGGVIFMMGGHAEMCPNYVSTCVDLLQQGLAECVGGRLETVTRDKSGEAIAMALSSRFGVGNATFRMGTPQHRYVDTVAFGAYRRDVIMNVGMLDEEFVRNQDDEFNHRLRKNGARILLAPEIHCRYYSRSSLRVLWRQYFLYGLWKVRVLQQHPWQMQVRQFIPALFVAACVLSLVSWCLSPRTKLAFLVLCGLYSIFSLTASAMIARRARKWQLLPLLPAAFATLHFAYGSGFIAGLARFWNRWKIAGAHCELGYEPAEK